jgi:hypothetical protein
MNTNAKRFFIILLFIWLNAALAQSFFTTSGAEAFEAASIRSYRDIPGVTDEEIAAIETLKSVQTHFSYGNIESSEIYRTDEDTLNGFTVLLCAHLTELFGHPFVAGTSAAANIGATALSETAKILEEAGNAGDSAAIERQGPAFIAALEALTKRINGVLLMRGANSSDQEKFDTTLLKEELPKLREAIQTMGADTISRISKNLRKLSQNAKIGGMTHEILDSILTGDYEEAVTLIS